MLNNEDTTITFGAKFEFPILILGIPSGAGMEHAHPRVRRISQYSAGLFLDESEACKFFCLFFVFIVSFKKNLSLFF